MIYTTQRKILDWVTNEFISQLKDICSSNKIVAEALENSQELISYDEYLVVLQNVLNELLTHHIRIPADILAIIDVVEDPHIWRLQALL